MHACSYSKLLYFSIKINNSETPFFIFDFYFIFTKDFASYLKRNYIPIEPRISFQYSALIIFLLVWIVSGFILVDGGWSDWVKSGDCSESCGGGMLAYIRTCTKPQPKYCGNECEGDTIKMEQCNVQPCPSKNNVHYSSFNTWSVFKHLI